MKSTMFHKSFMYSKTPPLQRDLISDQTRPGKLKYFTIPVKQAVGMPLGY